MKLPLLAAVAASLAFSALAHAITDPAGDLRPGFTSAANGDLDVLSADVTYDYMLQTITFTSTSADNIGKTAASSFVWGVNRGAGTAGFPTVSNNILFDRVVVLVPGGQSAVRGGPTGTPVINISSSLVTISGATISATIPANFLVSTGFTVDNYTYNLWPRVASPGGLPGISDFAPDTTNFKANVVPEPSALALLALAPLATSRRRR